ncbi:MAG: hypothetical protein CSA18_03965 [Deltaproteobacteria bacterium]|nr:MAG: hypothetical protein CSA18_03965 [Deltaproteobacteria bacterium]
MFPRNIILFPLFLYFVCFLTGCGKNQEDTKLKKEIKKVEVKVHTIKKQTYPIWLDFTGETEALESVYVTSRVSGELEKIYFKAGDVVSKDDILFKIDDKEYKSIVAQKQAALNKDKSRLNLEVVPIVKTNFG